MVGEIIFGCWFFVIWGYKEVDGGLKREGFKEKFKILLDLSFFNKLYIVILEIIILNL